MYHEQMDHPVVVLWNVSTVSSGYMVFGYMVFLAIWSDFCWSHLLINLFDIVTIFPTPKRQFQYLLPYCLVTSVLVSKFIGYCDYFALVPR